MTTQELIESGQLQLYVVGALPIEEAHEVDIAIAQNSEVKNEVEKIENSLITLAETVAPIMSAQIWLHIQRMITKVVPINEKRSINWAAITGWAAAILCICGIVWMLNQNKILKTDYQVTNSENIQLKEQVDNSETKLAKTENVLEILRSKEYAAYTLPGNEAVAPQAFAKVFYNKKDKIAYIDTKGLPPAPRGKVYQAWSLVMQPLTPTSMGILSSSNEIESGIYQFSDFPVAQAFGITLEPEGGSKTPTMSQLYTLGMVASTP